MNRRDAIGGMTAVALGSSLVTSLGTLWAASPSVPVGVIKRPDARYDPTPQAAVELMLVMAELVEGDVVYDLGCGDGRIVTTAARLYGTRGVGVDVDSDLIAYAERCARAEGVADRCEFRVADLFETNLSEASVVTLFLGIRLNDRLLPKLMGELRPGARVVSYMWAFTRWREVAERQLAGRSVYLWTV